MHIRRQSALLAFVALLLAAHTLGQPAPTQSIPEPIQLPKPQITAGTASMSLMQALAQRKTTRAFLDQPLPLQTLSNLLWAAFGVNRPRDVKAGLGRTAPSAITARTLNWMWFSWAVSMFTRPRRTACVRSSPATFAPKSAPKPPPTLL